VLKSAAIKIVRCGRRHIDAPVDGRAADQII
jgi:hypothetical protein